MFRRFSNRTAVNINFKDDKQNRIVNDADFWLNKIFKESAIWVAIITIIGGNIIAYFFQKRQRETDIHLKQMQERYESRQHVIHQITELMGDIKYSINAGIEMDSSNAFSGEQRNEMIDIFNALEEKWMSKEYLFAIQLCWTVENPVEIKKIWNKLFVDVCNMLKIYSDYLNYRDNKKGVKFDEEWFKKEYLDPINNDLDKLISCINSSNQSENRGIW